MKIVFCGTSPFAVQILKALCRHNLAPVMVVTQPGKQAGRGAKITPTPVFVAATELGLPVLEPVNINDQVTDLGKPDLLVTAAYGGWLGRRVRQLPAKGCINVHASLLPAYRGAAPINRAIMAGETETGISIFKMVAAMDAGPVLLKQAVPILPEDNFTSLHERLAQVGGECLIKAIALINNDLSSLENQDEQFVSYAAKLTSTDEKIRWSHSAEEILNQIRGLSWEPGAVCLYHGKRLKILQATLLASTNGKTGSVVQIIKNKGFIIAGKKNDLLVTFVQAEGKKRQDAYSFTLGARMAVGDELTELV